MLIKPTEQAQKPVPPALDALMQRNIEAVTRIEQAAHAERSRADRISDAIARFCGSTAFVYVHCALYGAWLIWNSTATSAFQRFDPPPFNILNLVVALEAVFLSTFILISQNRQQRLSDQRNHLDLQINLLAEQESSQMLIMMKRGMDHLGIDDQEDVVQALGEATDPERLVEHIQQAIPVDPDQSENQQDNVT